MQVQGCGHVERSWSERPRCTHCMKNRDTLAEVQRDPFRPRDSDIDGPDGWAQPKPEHDGIPY